MRRGRGLLFDILLIWPLVLTVATMLGSRFVGKDQYPTQPINIRILHVVKCRVLVHIAFQHDMDVCTAQIAITIVSGSAIINRADTTKRHRLSYTRTRALSRMHAQHPFYRTAHSLTDPNCAPHPSTHAILITYPVTLGTIAHQPLEYIINK